MVSIAEEGQRLPNSSLKTKVLMVCAASQAHFCLGGTPLFDTRCLIVAFFDRCLIATAQGPLVAEYPSNPVTPQITS